MRCGGVGEGVGGEDESACQITHVLLQYFEVAIHGRLRTTHNKSHQSDVGRGLRNGKQVVKLNPVTNPTPSPGTYGLNSAFNASFDTTASPGTYRLNCTLLKYATLMASNLRPMHSIAPNLSSSLEQSRVTPSLCTDLPQPCERLKLDKPKDPSL